MGMYDGTDAQREDMGSAASAVKSAPPKDSSKRSQAIEQAGADLSRKGQDMIADARGQAAANANRPTPVNLPNYRKGGKVRKTGPAYLHKGEKVVPKKDVKRVEKKLRTKKGRKSGRGM